MVNVFLALTHLPTALAAILRMDLTSIAVIGCGILACISGSSFPGTTLHAAGDMVRFSLICRSARAARSATVAARRRGWNEPRFWIYAGEIVVLALLALWAFRRLSAAASRETRSAKALLSNTRSFTTHRTSARCYQ